MRWLQEIDYLILHPNVNSTLSLIDSIFAGVVEYGITACTVSENYTKEHLFLCSFFTAEHHFPLLNIHLQPFWFPSSFPSFLTFKSSSDQMSNNQHKATLVDILISLPKMIFSALLYITLDVKLNSDAILPRLEYRYWKSLFVYCHIVQ